jgi:small subunit ribosomal protein S2
LEYIVITVEQMVDSGVHLGHQVRRWNPKMAPYIYGERNGIHIIDILQTLICLKDTTNYLSKVGKESAVR